MAKEKRRSTRMGSNLPVKLMLRDNASNSNMTEPVAGQINDMSTHGVRITVPRIRFGNYHLFYTFNDNASQTILLEVSPPEGDIPITIPCQPIWFDHILSEPSKPFQLGMEFLVSPENVEVLRLKDLLAREQREGGANWWQKIFG